MKKLILSTLFLAILLLSNCGKEERDPCEGIVCLNGGICFNGGCDCPPERTGLDCGEETIPTSMTISRVTVTKLPANNNGLNWDVLSAPDLQVIFLLDGTTDLLSQSGTIDNADITENHTFSNLNFMATDVQSRYAISVYDVDTGSNNDFMGGITFVPYRVGQNFPTEITLDAGGDVTFEILVSYNFD